MVEVFQIEIQNGVKKAVKKALLIEAAENYLDHLKQLSSSAPGDATTLKQISDVEIYLKRVQEAK